MIPKSLSASAASSYESCAARFKAEYIDRTPDLQNDAAAKGSFCHAVLETWVQGGWHVHEWPNIMAREKAMHVIFDSLYYDYFEDREHYGECWQLVNRWLQRTSFQGRNVLSTEVKQSFNLPTSIGPLPFNYIFDRADWLEEQDILEIIDYKTVIIPIQPDDLKKRIQPRSYSLAGRIAYKIPESKKIKVTFDLLRYDTVGVAFTRDDDVDTWNYLVALAERIIADDGETETLNPECRFCVRKQVCETLQKHTDGGGVLGIATMADAAERRAKLEMAINGMNAAKTQLDDMLLDMMEQEGIYEFDTEGFEVKVAVQSRRHVESERAAKILGPEIMQRWGNIGVGDLDKILETEELTGNQKSQLKQLVTKRAGSPRIQTKLKSKFEED